MIKCLKHGEEAEETSDESASSGIAGSSSTSVLGRRGGDGGAGDVAGGSLRLAVTDLSDDGPGSRGDRPGGWSLGLAVRDLRDDGSSGLRRLGLTIGNLRDSGTTRPWRRSLGLAIRDLRDDRTTGPWGSSLGLSIANLRNDRARRRCLRLAVGDLRDTRRLSDLGLTIGNLRSTAASCNSYNVDGDTLSTNTLAVQVVESARETLVPYSGCRAASRGESEGAVAADREARRLASTSLETGIILQLVIAGDVSLTTSLILEDTILEAQGQGASLLASFEPALAGGAGDIDGLYIESSGTGSGATWWRSSLSESRRSSKGEYGKGLHFQKVNGTGD
jgi:hypothetical protein